MVGFRKNPAVWTPADAEGDPGYCPTAPAHPLFGVRLFLLYGWRQPRRDLLRTPQEASSLSRTQDLVLMYVCYFACEVLMTVLGSPWVCVVGKGRPLCSGAWGGMEESGNAGGQAPASWAELGLPCADAGASCWGALSWERQIGIWVFGAGGETSCHGLEVGLSSRRSAAGP